jgi:alanine racemase
VGDRAVFLGRDQEEVLRAEELAGWAQTISYEIYCALGTANIRRYTGA